MNIINEEMVRHVASLAKIHVNEEDIKNYQSHLEKVLSYVEELQEVDVEGLLPFVGPVREHLELLQLDQQLREDKISASLPVQELLKNAPKSQLNQIKVEAVIEEE